MPGPAAVTDDVTENKFDWGAVLRKFTLQWGAESRQNPIVITSRTKNNQVKQQVAGLRAPEIGWSKKGLFAEVTPELSQAWADQGPACQAEETARIVT